MDHSTEEGLPLKGRARLDNCVTVLDAAELFLNLDSIKSLQVTQHTFEGDADTTELLAPVRPFLYRIMIKLQLRRAPAI